MLENPPRLTFLEYGIDMAFTASKRATCRRRIVGCALFNNHKRVVTTGYNGAPAGAPQCDEKGVGCLMVDGHCKRITHAERNAVIFSGGQDLKDGYAFVTTRPCKDCFDLLVAVGIAKIYYIEDYRLEDTKEYIAKVCQEKRITFEQINSNLIQLQQKGLDFHKGSGGLLTSYPDLKIEEPPKEMMDH